MAAVQIVVAAALIAADGRILVQQRRANAQHGGLWEFPGGKAEAGEALADALARELSEELGIVVDPAACRPWTFATVAPPPGTSSGGLLLLLYRITRWSGTPACLDAAQLAWIAPDRLADLAMPPADIDLVSAMACQP